MLVSRDGWEQVYGVPTHQMSDYQIDRELVEQLKIISMLVGIEYIANMQLMLGITMSLH